MSPGDSSLDVLIQTPTEQSAAFKRSLQRFLDVGSFGRDEGFTMHWSEPRGDAVLQHVSFDSAAVAQAFETSWRLDGGWYD